MALGRIHAHIDIYNLEITRYNNSDIVCYFKEIL